MNKVIISLISASLLFGFSQVSEAKEHRGPSADRSSSYNSSSARDRGVSRDKGHRGAERRADSHRDNKGKHRYRGDRDRRRHADNSRRHQSRDRYRNNHRPRYKHRNYKHYNPRTYPTNVYYLGQDWHYYGGYYHPFPRHHIHTRYCQHRYWEPLAVGIILGSVIGW